MVTMREVARRAGVSQSTVSHYLNQTRPVHPDTQQAIQAAIEATGYVHDAIASSLRTGRSNTIGLAITAISNPYFAALVRRIEQRVAEFRQTVLLVDTADDAERELEAVRQLVRHRPDAVLLAPAGSTSAALDLLLEREIPTVLVDRVPPAVPARVDAVGVENHGPMRELVEYLGRQGHRSIALLAGVAGIPTTTERLAGYEEAIAALGGQARPMVEHASLDASETAAALDALLGVAPRPTAVVGGNNQATIAIMRWVREHGLQVPADISVAGFDDFEWAEFFEPRLTTVRQPIEELAAATTALLESRLEDPSQPTRIVRLPPELLVRDSVRRLD